MTLNLYLFTGSPIKINKTLPTPTVISGDRVEGNQDVTAPSFIISSASIPNYNYAYVPDLSRYYFITGVIWIADSLWRLNLQVDVLKTYESRINLLSGTIKYSSLGSTAIQDPRVSMDSIVSNVTTASSLSDTAYYVLRYWDIGPSSTSVYKRTPQIAFMNATVFSRFWDQLATKSEDDQVIIGNSIIDVSIVHYLKDSGVKSLPSFGLIKFRNAGAANEITVNLWTDPGTLPGPDDLAYFIEQPEDVYKLNYKEYDTGATWTDGYFWNGSAKWRLMLPYAGSVDIVPQESGYANITYCALRVAYEPYENAYIITPVINETTETAYAVTIPVQTTFAFPIDSSFDNIAGNRIASVLTSAGTLAAGVGLTSAGNPTGLMMLASGITSGVNTLQQLDVRENMATTRYAGTTGGVPAYTGSPDPTKIYWIKRSGIPRPGYSDLWSTYGKPDGAFRALSTLSGYYQVGDINLANMDTATASERDQIKSLLLSGVIA